MKNEIKLRYVLEDTDNGIDLTRYPIKTSEDFLSIRQILAMTRDLTEVFVYTYTKEAKNKNMDPMETLRSVKHMLDNITIDVMRDAMAKTLVEALGNIADEIKTEPEADA